jgi:hypothetical protein
VDVTVIKEAEGKHRAVIVRTDGTTAQFAIYDYGSDLPHDLAHFVVEEVLGLAHGFYGLLARGANLRALQTVGARDPRSITKSDALVAEYAGELTQAETLVNALSGPQRDPDGPAAVSQGDRATITARLEALNAAWQALAPGERLQLIWPERA